MINQTLYYEINHNASGIAEPTHINRETNGTEDVGDIRIVENEAYDEV